jgi:hypothetical protein
MKTDAEHFADWEAEVFGFGYGTGEPHVLGALKTFLELCGDAPYDYSEIERALTPATAWLMINALCRDGVGIIEYGTSPRCGWLTPQGKALRAFVTAHTIEELTGLTERDNLDYCAPSFCNCGLHGYSKDKICHNPFWVECP